MIPVEPYIEWVKLEERRPYKTQLVEILAYQPAVYLGTNDYGCDVWDQYEMLERVIYWRPLKDKKAYEIIYPEMLRRYNFQNSVEK